MRCSIPALPLEEACMGSDMVKEGERCARTPLFHTCLRRTAAERTVLGLEALFQPEIIAFAPRAV